MNQSPKDAKIYSDLLRIRNFDENFMAKKYWDYELLFSNKEYEKCVEMCDAANAELKESSLFYSKIAHQFDYIKGYALGKLSRFQESITVMLQMVERVRQLFGHYMAFKLHALREFEVYSEGEINSFAG